MRAVTKFVKLLVVSLKGESRGVCVYRDSVWWEEIVEIYVCLFCNDFVEKRGIFCEGFRKFVSPLGIRGGHTKSCCGYGPQAPSCV